MIQSRGLRFAYAAHAELKFPDIDLAAGGWLVLRGASGSGKSTLLALLAALLSPSAGSLQVAGQDLLALKGAARDAWRGRHVGFLPQRLYLNEALTVENNLGLAFFAAGLPQDSEKIDAALQALGIEQLAKRRTRELSGGQAQRVALARAVLLRPSMILADEPTASLDDLACEQACALLAQAATHSGASLVIATHDARVSAWLSCQALPHHTLHLAAERTAS